MSQDSKSTGVAQKENAFTAWPRIFVFLNFIMLCSMTIAQKPMQQAMDALSDTNKLKATAFVCDEARAMVDVADKQIRDVFISGCAWNLIEFNVYVKVIQNGKMTEKELQEYKSSLIEQWNSEEGSFYEDTMNHCAKGAAAKSQEGRMASAITMNMMEKLECSKVYRELEKRGISKEDDKKE